MNRFPQLNLEYKDPEQNFDRSRVKGLVCNLFEIKDPKFSNALEVAAGGKVFIFFNIIFIVIRTVRYLKIF